MRATLAIMGLMAASTAVQGAEAENEPLDDAFLEYLAEMEADDDNWTLLADGRSQSQPSSKASSEAPAPRKSYEEAAKPPARER